MPDQLAFTKMQGVGNDFVVIDGRDRGDYDWSALAIEMCDRNMGIGADGLLVVDSTNFADIMMRMYNPDGTPDVCGNGLRCISRYAIERGIVRDDTLRVNTLAGVRPAEALRDRQGNITAVTIGMGLPRFEPSGIPMRASRNPVMDFPLDLRDGGSLPITALSTGSTHAVTFVSELPYDPEFFAISPQVEHHPLFPERTSLMWCHQEDRHRLRLRIWERGAGETWGCGTGSCAAAVAAVMHGYADENAPITVASKGGELIIRWKPGEPIEMTGPAVCVYEGRYNLESARSASRPTV